MSVFSSKDIISKVILNGPISEFVDDIDLQMLFNLIKRHKLFPLISRDFLEKLPSDSNKFWRDEIKILNIKSHMLARILVEVIGQTTKNGINVISIKGPVLAQSLFGDLGKRHFGDLDLVVKRKDFLNLVTKLEELGYDLISPKIGLTPDLWDYYFKYKKDVVLVNKKTGVFIELHVGVYQNELLREADESIMWENLDEVVIEGFPINTMNKENMFLYLFYHGGWHLYFRLFWLRDVAEAINRWNLDHRKVLDNSLSLGIDRMMGLGLLLVKELFEVPIPEVYNQYLDRHQKILGKLKLMCLMKIFGPEQDTFIWKLRRFRYNLMLKAGFKYKVAVISSIYHRWYIRKYLGGH